MGNHSTKSAADESGFVNKTFRLKKEQLRKLELDAVRTGISTNGLITTILSKFLEWDRYAGEVNFVSLPPNMLEGILSQISEETMTKAGKYVADKSCFKDMSIHFFQGYDSSLFTKMTLLFDRYANHYKVQGERGDNGSNTDISFYHNLGKKWSLFIASLLHNELLRLGLEDHAYEVSENAVIFSFPKVIPLPSDHLLKQKE